MHEEFFEGGNLCCCVWLWCSAIRRPRVHMVAVLHLAEECPPPTGSRYITVIIADVSILSQHIVL